MSAIFNLNIVIAARMIDPKPEAEIGRASFLALTRRAPLLRKCPLDTPFHPPDD